MQTIRGVARAGGVALALAGLATPAAAHSGTTHAGTPHWLLFVLALVGGALVAGSATAYRRGSLGGTLGASIAFAGVVVGAFGLVGLVELQVVADAAPELTAIYPTLSLAVGAVMATGSLVVGRVKWPERPRYAALGILLAAWVVYPVVMTNGGTYHPAGYALVFAVLAAIAYVLRRDAWGVVQSLRLDRRPLAAGLLSGVLFSVFFAFSSGTVTLNPDNGVGLPTDPLVVVMPVSDPLVAWPAVEFVFPSIPLAGYVSVGTLLLMVILGGLVALNVGVLAQQWRATAARRASEADGTRTSALGMLATTGATACCCCAPAFYGVLSVLLGASATPVYWAFLDPSSPVGGTFFAASVLLLLGSIVRATGGRSESGASSSLQ
ncbi:hypothetical protein [Halobacterium zhouii]|uniref:hypothetical protein n=1 Tax=Halobacterium zhouii TaxID=2902624 RepID=UPI001E31312A|nr:hypothetical protein [Halobacterium zhouii]